MLNLYRGLISTPVLQSAKFLIAGHCRSIIRKGLHQVEILGHSGIKSKPCGDGQSLN